MGNKSSRAASEGERLLAQRLSQRSALTPELFDVTAVGHHGVPSNARAMALCGRQGILAVGTASGAVKLYGKDGLEVLLEAPRSQANLTVGVTLMKFSGHQRLVVAYSDSSIRVFELSAQSRRDLMVAEVPGSWTTYSITSLETIQFANYPYFFVATDNGAIHVGLAGGRPCKS